MKKLFAIIFLTAISLGASSQQYGWKDISANLPGTPNLTDVFFVSDDEGWITSSSIAEIYHTTDGGQTFEVQTTLYTCNAIHMLNANVGYAGGASGFIYKTTDGGEHWDFHGTMSTTLADISFPPAGDTGYCCGLNGNIWMIHSTGVTKMNSGVPDTQTGISFPVNSSEGWVCGGSIIRHFINGTWTAADQDYPSGGYNAIYMVDSLNGWVVGDGGIIALTTDGKNWFEQTNPDPQNHTLIKVYFLNTNQGWAINSGGRILHTINGGTTWTIEADGLTTNTLLGIHFTSPTNGYAVGIGKTLLKYTEISGIGDNIQNLEFEVYPNPCRDKISIRHSAPGTNVIPSGVEGQNSKLKIVDLYGRVVYEYKNSGVRESEIIVDVSHLPSGLYLVKLQTEDGVGVRKIIKL
jgi:photosystem II stability/assembly factor-like uncharacterized protein